MIQNVFMYLDSILCNLILLGAKVKQKTLLGAKVRNISYSELRLGTYPICDEELSYMKIRKETYPT